jgi:hypothetical protein
MSDYAAPGLPQTIGAALGVQYPPGAAAPLNTWDAVKSSASLAVSGGGTILTYTAAGPGWRVGMSTLAYSRPFVSAAPNPNFCAAGVGNISTNVGAFPGVDLNSVGIEPTIGNVIQNNVPVGNCGFTYAGGDTIGIDFDLAGNQIRTNKNGGAYGAYVAIANMGATIYCITGVFTNGSTVTTIF